MKIYCSACKKVITSEIPEGTQEITCPECSAPVAVPENQLAPGAVIGDFLLEKPLSGGGMGMVYLARQISLDRPVALKVLHEKFAGNQEYIEGLFREARAAAKLTHPNIVQAYAVGEENGIFYFAMEYIRGETFKQILKQKNVLDFDQAVKVIKEICGALQAAWNEQKLVHQDIKPDNIMLDSNGFAKLADLGLARSANADTAPDENETEVMGTPQYISPEQLTGVPTDVRSDLYSLGATFYQFVTGQFPYPEESAEAMAQKHVEGNLTPPKEINPELPQALNDIIVKMMARHIEERYQMPSDVIADLNAYSEHKKTGAAAMPKLSLNFNKKTAPGVPAAKPGLPGKGTMPSRPGLSIPGSKPGLPGMPGKPAVPPKPAIPAKPAMPTPPAKSAVPTPPGKPTAPAKPAAPTAKLVVPEKPAAPAAKLVVPEKPAAPAAKLVVPEKPAVPEKTEVPAEQPVQPQAQAEPATAPAAEAVSAEVPPSPKKDEELTLAPKAPKPAAEKAEQEDKKDEGKKKGKGKDKDKEDKNKGKERIARPNRNAASLISICVVLPLVVIVLAVAFYFLGKGGKLPAGLKNTGDKYVAFVNSVFKIKTNAPEAKADAQTDAKTAGAPAVKPVAPPKKEEPPKPVTRPEFLEKVNKILSDYQLAPDKPEQFLTAAEKLMAQYLPVGTPEEAAALAMLKKNYAPADEYERFRPVRQKAIEAIETRWAKEAKAKEDELQKKQAEEKKQQEAAERYRKAQEAQSAQQKIVEKEVAERTALLKATLTPWYQALAEEFFKAIKANDKQILDAACKTAEENYASLSSSHASVDEGVMKAEFEEFYKTFLTTAFAELQSFHAQLNKINKKQRPPLTVATADSMVDLTAIIPGDGVYHEVSGAKGNKLVKHRLTKNFRRAMYQAMENSLGLRNHIFYYELIEKNLSADAVKQIPKDKKGLWFKYIKRLSPPLKSKVQLPSGTSTAAPPQKPKTPPKTTAKTPVRQPAKKAAPAKKATAGKTKQKTNKKK